MELITVIFASVLIRTSLAEQCTSSYNIENKCPSIYGPSSTVSHQIRSVSECTGICSKQPYCNSAIFDRVATTCTTNAWKLWKLSTSCYSNQTITYVELKKSSCKAVIFENCLGDTDCSTANASCYHGTCQCRMGFAYDRNSMKCTARCDSYGSTFSINHSYTLVGNVTFVPYGGITLQNCADYCLITTRLTCRSFNFALSDGTCFVMDVTSQDKSVHGISSRYFDHYTRNCI